MTLDTLKRTHPDAWVCVDCYFAHHYGARQVDGEWFAGESDTPADREPLALLEGYELGDGTGENGEGSDTLPQKTGGMRARLQRILDRERCRYTDCARGHPIARDHERVSCPSCRAWLGLP